MPRNDNVDEYNYVVYTGHMGNANLSEIKPAHNYWYCYYTHTHIYIHTYIHTRTYTHKAVIAVYYFEELESHTHTHILTHRSTTVGGQVEEGQFMMSALCAYNVGLNCCFTKKVA